MSRVSGKLIGLPTFFCPEERRKSKRLSWRLRTLGAWWIVNRLIALTFVRHLQGRINFGEVYSIKKKNLLQWYWLSPSSRSGLVKPLSAFAIESACKISRERSRKASKVLERNLHERHCT